MGSDKRYLEIDGDTFLRRSYENLAAAFGEVFIAANDTPVGVPVSSVIEDRYPGTGPIGGIAAGLEAASSDPVFVMACDIPHIDFGLISALYRGIPGYEVAVPVRADGRYEPLYALYRRSILSAIERLVSSREYRIRLAFSDSNTARIPIPPGTGISNINTRSEYENITRPGR